MSAPPVDGFIEQDARGIISGWSAAAAALFGWPEAEAIGMRSHLLVPERNRARHDAALDTFLRSPAREVQRQEFAALHRDGHEFRAEFDISLEERGGMLFVAALVRAITPDARTEAAFRQSGERYRAILDQIEDGCCVVDLRGNYLFVNDAFCRLYGFEKHEILGSNFKVSAGPERTTTLREMYSQLTKRGHQVTVVSTGREALHALQAGAFELVLMDVQMPDMDGFEATAAIRARERDTGQHVRIVAMTAHAMVGDKERCLAAGMDGYLSKPIDQRSLYAVVEA